MELHQLTCPRCNHTADLLVGTPDLEQTFSDLNEDFACYKFFVCPRGNDIDFIDINFREFDGRCPRHGVEFRPLTNSPETCLRCGGPVQVTRKDILRPER